MKIILLFSILLLTIVSLHAQEDYKNDPRFLSFIAPATQIVYQPVVMIELKPIIPCKSFYVSYPDQSIGVIYLRATDKDVRP